MAVSAIILDLDDTLVDTSMLAGLRRQRRWRDVFRRINETVAYEGIVDLVNAARKNGLAVGVVTRSVSNYANAVLDNHGISYDALVAYHDCRNQKPSPDPVNLCLKKLGLGPDAALGLGDSEDDCLAYLAAEIPALGAGWSNELAGSAPWTRIVTVEEFSSLIIEAPKPLPSS
ncbi:HAD family hydrolase [Roseovarius sp.]|uniref:HAD family hydrolase n=1 Tax=Roseovarius sp. TaxID=1486281 RepID=UPI003A987541